MTVSKEIRTKYNKPFILNRADPYIVRYTDGNYYFTATSPLYDRIIIRKSGTLMGLKDAPEHVIWERHEKGNMSRHIWAPELHYIDGSWYIYFAASRVSSKWRLRPYILKCRGQDPVNDRWDEMGQIRCADDDIYSFRAFSLDSTVFTHRGKLYIIWAEKVSVGIQISNLYIAEMESPTKLKTCQVLLTTPDYDWERRDIWVNEGPAVIKHGGKIYVTYSASATGECYCMGMLEINEDEDILDPRAWKKRRQPVLKSDPEKGFFGPGHNSFTYLPDGTPVCVFHARTYSEIEGDPLDDPNRHCFIMKVKWNNDGSPEFSFDEILA